LAKRACPHYYLIIISSSSHNYLIIISSLSLCASHRDGQLKTELFPPEKGTHSPSWPNGPVHIMISSLSHYYLIIISSLSHHYLIIISSLSLCASHPGGQLKTELFPPEKGTHSSSWPNGPVLIMISS
jgi:hypothetical protein